MSRLFDHVSPSEFIASTTLIVDATLFFSLAAAFLALWSTARDYRVFRSMGTYLTLAGIQVIWIYFGGQKSAWALAALTAPFLVMIAGEAMRVPNHRWALLIWPICLVVFCLG